MKRKRPLENHTEPELVLREMLLHDVYDLPSATDGLQATFSCRATADLGPEAVAHLHLRRRTGPHGGAELNRL